MTDVTQAYKPIFYFLSEKNQFVVSGSTILGRKGSEICIPDPQLSSRHCEFIFRGIKLFVKDLGSKNGTFLNGKKLEVNEEVEINVGDNIRLGSFSYKVDDHNSKVNVTSSREVKKLSFVQIIIEMSLFRKISYVVFAIIYFAIIYDIITPDFALSSKFLIYLSTIVSNEMPLNLTITSFFLLLMYLFHASIRHKYLREARLISTIIFVLFFGVTLIFSATILAIIKNSKIENYVKSRTEYAEATTEDRVLLEKKFKEYAKSLIHDIPLDKQVLLREDYELVVKRKLYEI